VPPLRFIPATGYEPGAHDSVDNELRHCSQEPPATTEELIKRDDGIQSGVIGCEYEDSHGIVE